MAFRLRKLQCMSFRYVRLRVYRIRKAYLKVWLVCLNTSDNITSVNTVDKPYIVRSQEFLPTYRVWFKRILFHRNHNTVIHTYNTHYDLNESILYV